MVPDMDVGVVRKSFYEIFVGGIKRMVEAMEDCCGPMCGAEPVFVGGGGFDGLALGAFDDDQGHYFIGPCGGCAIASGDTFPAGKVDELFILIVITDKSSEFTRVDEVGNDGN